MLGKWKKKSLRKIAAHSASLLHSWNSDLSKRWFLDNISSPTPLSYYQYIYSLPHPIFVVYYSKYLENLSYLQPYDSKTIDGIDLYIMVKNSSIITNLFIFKSDFYSCKKLKYCLFLAESYKNKFNKKISPKSV